MNDVLDVVIHDEETVTELRLVTELMVVASMAPGTLDQDVIDAALGMQRAPKQFPIQRRTD
jgi:hypothetical protein